MSVHGAVSPSVDTARLAEVRALEERGAAGLDALITMLADPSWSVRREVVRALSGLGEVAVAALCETLRTQRDNEARIAATVDALVASIGEHVDAGVIALASEPDPHVLADVAQILGRRRSTQGSATLVALAEHDDDNVAVHAIEALGRLGGRTAIDALVACVQSANFFRIFPAIDVLGRSCDPRTVAPLAALLGDPRYALEAARALGRSADRRAIAPLATLIASPSAGQARVAGVALVELCERHAQLYGSAAAVEEAVRAALTEPLVGRLIKSFSGADKAEKIALCRLFGFVRSEACTPFLIQQLGAEPELAEAAGRALVDIGRTAESAFYDALSHADSPSRITLLPLAMKQENSPALVACLSDANVDVRVLACEALARVGGVSGVPALFGLLEDPSQRVVYAAVSAIHALGTADTEHLAMRAIASKKPATRRAALRVLAYFGFENALPVFVSVIAEREPRLRDIALEGLSLLEQPEARRHLLAVAGDEDPAARAAAVRALRHVSDDEAVVACLAQALSDPDPWVRYYACQALGKLGVRSADSPISALLADEAGQVRVAAIEALSHLGTELALSALRRLSSAADLDLKRAALVGLGLARDRVSLPVLTEASREGDPATQLVAMASLASLDAPEVVATLREVATSGSESVRVAAVNLLAERPTREAADALVALMLREGTREALQAALARPREGVVPALFAALAYADDDSAIVLTACLSRLRTEESSAALYQALLLPNTAARKAAVSAVAAFATDDARTALHQLGQLDLDPEVRRICNLYLAL